MPAGISFTPCSLHILADRSGLLQHRPSLPPLPTFIPLPSDRFYFVLLPRLSLVRLLLRSFSYSLFFYLFPFLFPFFSFFFCIDTAFFYSTSVFPRFLPSSARFSPLLPTIRGNNIFEKECHFTRDTFIKCTILLILLRFSATFSFPAFALLITLSGYLRGYFCFPEQGSLKRFVFHSFRMHLVLRLL